MPINAPQSDLPLGITGSSDVWDEGPAGVILSGEFFDAAPPAGSATVSVADPFSLALTAQTAADRLRGVAAPTSFTIAALDAQSTVATGAVNIQSSATPFSLALTASAATNRLRGVAAPTSFALTASTTSSTLRNMGVPASLSLTTSAASARIRSTAAPTNYGLTASPATDKVASFGQSANHALTFNDATGRAAYISLAAPAEYSVSAFNVASGLRSSATPAGYGLTLFEATSEAQQATIVISEAAPFSMGFTFSTARVRMEYDMILQQELTPAQIQAIALAVLVAAQGSPIRSDSHLINGHPIVGSGSEADPWRGAGVSP